MADRLIWNRTCNVNGGEGNNIPLDLMVEHYNRVFKDDLNTFRSNIGEKSVGRSSRAIGIMKEMLDKFDSIINRLYAISVPAWLDVHSIFSGHHCGAE